MDEFGLTPANIDDGLPALVVGAGEQASPIAKPDARAPDSNHEPDSDSSEEPNGVRVEMAGNEIWEKEWRERGMDMSITSSEIVKNAFTVYLVDVEYRGVRWCVKRRYRHFHALHKQLQRTFPEQELPAFPPKVMSSSTSAAVVEGRTRALNKYVQCLSRMELVCHSDLIGDFLSPDFDGAPHTTPQAASSSAPDQSLHTNPFDVAIEHQGAEEFLTKPHQYASRPVAFSLPHPRPKEQEDNQHAQDDARRRAAARKSVKVAHVDDVVDWLSSAWSSNRDAPSFEVHARERSCSTPSHPQTPNPIASGRSEDCAGGDGEKRDLKTMLAWISAKLGLADQQQAQQPAQSWAQASPLRVSEGDLQDEQRQQILKDKEERWRQEEVERHERAMQQERERQERAKRLREEEEQRNQQLAQQAANEKIDMERVEKEKVERERAEQERVEREKEMERAEKERVEKEAREKEEKERVAREKEEKARVARERAEREREEKATREKAEREKAERERAEKAAREKAEREKAERERVAREKLEKERAARERAQREKAERERAEKDRAEKAERENAEKEKAVKAERERAEKEKEERRQRKQERRAREEAERKERAHDAQHGHEGVEPAPVSPLAKRFSGMFTGLFDQPKGPERSAVPRASRGEGNGEEDDECKRQRENQEIMKGAAERKRERKPNKEQQAPQVDEEPLLFKLDQTAWTQYQAEDGRAYFHNKETNHTTWCKADVIAAEWMEFPNATPGHPPYYHNRVTGQTTWEVPARVNLEQARLRGRQQLKIRDLRQRDRDEQYRTEERVHYERAYKQRVDGWAAGKVELWEYVAGLPSIVEVPEQTLPQLQLSAASSHNDTRKAYRRAMLLLHPDKQSGSLPPHEVALRSLVFDVLTQRYTKFCDAA